jgi:hypothetical protein
MHLVRQAFYSGPKFLAFGAMLAAAGLSFYWGKSAVELLVLLIALVPASGLAGATLGLVLLPLAQAIVGLLRIGSAYWIAAHAILVTTLACLSVLPWAAWVAGGVGPAVNGRQGTYILFIPAAIAGLICGMLFGRAMQLYADKVSRDSI